MSEEDQKRSLEVIEDCTDYWRRNTNIDPECDLGCGHVSKNYAEKLVHNFTAHGAYTRCEKCSIALSGSLMQRHEQANCD